jgi:hypothetical protein
MNREYKAKSQACYSVIGNSQTLALGGQPAVNKTNFQLTGTPQKPVMLGVLNIEATQKGLINDIKVAGQSVFCSDESADIGMFHTTSHAVQERYCGITLGAGLDVFIDGTLETAGNAYFAWMVDEIKAPVSKAQQAEMYDYVFGLGSASIDGSSTGVLRAVSVRPCTLGELILTTTNEADSGDLFITSVKVGGEELLTGAGDQEINIRTFNYHQPNVQGANLDFQIGSNVPVQITIRNVNDTLARTVRGGIFCRA